MSEFLGLKGSLIKNKDFNVEEKEVEEVLSDNIKEPLLDLDKCSLNELINIMQRFANDPSLMFIKLVLDPL
jgi:hypothetical protein